MLLYIDNMPRYITKKIEYKCNECSKIFIDWSIYKKKFCSRSCAARFQGKYNNPAKFPGVGDKISKTKKGINVFKNKGIPHPMLGKKHSDITKKKISQINLGMRTGEEHWRYISDRTKLASRNVRNDVLYKEWRKNVQTRDDNECKISNQDCMGKIEVHHILGWKSHPELRYQINNGITLCHAHHPKKRKDEAERSPFFQKLVIEME